MLVLARWDPRAQGVVGFLPQEPTDVALGNGHQHLFLSLWALNEQSFCFKRSNGRLFIGLVHARPARKRQRTRRR